MFRRVRYCPRKQRMVAATTSVIPVANYIPGLYASWNPKQ